MLHEKNKKITAVIGYLGQSYNIVVLPLIFFCVPFIYLLITKSEFTRSLRVFKPLLPIFIIIYSSIASEKEHAKV